MAGHPVLKAALQLRSILSTMQPARTLLLSIALLSCVSTEAADWDKLRIGFQGQAKPGRWLPIEAVCSDLPADAIVELHVTAPDPRGDLLTKVVDQQNVAADGRVRLSGLCRIGRLSGQAVVQLVSDEAIFLRHAVLFNNQLNVDTDQPVQSELAMRKLDPVTLLTCGPLEGMEEFLRNVAVFSTPEPSIVQHLSLASVRDLPSDSLALDMVDLLLLTDDFSLTKQQADAVKHWVYTGGQLMISSGSTVQQLKQSPLGEWLDPHFQFDKQPQELRRFSSLEGFVAGASRIQTSLQNRSAWPVARILNNQVAVIVDSIDGPLIGRRSIGGGVVTMVAVDVNQLPLKNWTSLPQFYEKLLLGEKLTREKVTRTRTSRISQSGISDLGTQLLATVDAKPPAGQWSTWSVMALVVIWLAAIGPLDYLLVSRLLKKPHLTWITFPLMIVIGISVILGATADREAAHVRQLQVLDYFVDGDEHRMTGRAIVSVSAPDTSLVDLQTNPDATSDLFSVADRSDTAPPAGAAASDGSSTAQNNNNNSESPAASRPVLTWSGRAEDVFGAMYREGGIGLGRQTFYQKFEQDHQLADVPLLTGGSRAFEVSWKTQTSPVIDSELSVSGFGLLNGSFAHTLPRPIRDWIVVHGNRVYRPTNKESRVLAAGDRWNAQSSGIVSVELKSHLNAARRIDNPGRDPDSPLSQQTSLQAQSPYNIQSADPMYIASMISFFNAAGGAEYVELSNAQFRDLEVSSTVRLNHAVLLGFVDQADSVVTTDDIQIGSVDSQILARLFLPVRRQPAESLARSREEAREDNN